MGDVLYLLSRLPVPWWMVLAGPVVLLGAAIVVGRWLRRRDDRESLHGDTAMWMRALDRLASWLGYVPKDSTLQSSIAFKGDDRAHIVLRVGDYHLVGEVDCFKAKPE